MTHRTTTTNDLMEQCIAVWRRHDASEDFKIIYGADSEPSRRWYVGFYERDQGKITATGATINDALRAWLAAWSS